MEAERGRRTRVRNPLSDCTNTVNSSQSSSSAAKATASSLLRKSRKSVLSSAIGKFLANDEAAPVKSAAGSDGAGDSAAAPALQVEATPSRPPQRPSSALGMDSSPFGFRVFSLDLCWELGFWF